MLTASTFYQLSFQQQADSLLREATFIHSRLEDNLVVDLYELHDLLVEIFFLKENEDLVSIMAYNATDKLQVVTKGINLKPRLTIKPEKNCFKAKEFCA